LRTILGAFCIALASVPAGAETALVAVATNFAGAAEEVAAAYAEASGYQVAVTAGATGKLFAQIEAGAPFDAFLSADAATPEKLEASGTAVAGSRFTYALGTLALWSADPARDLSEPAAALAAARHVAVANPDLAPYGRAAMETLVYLGAAETAAPRLVTAENVGQAYTLVATGAAEVGFVALSSVIAGETKGAVFPVPETCHAPIRQDAVLLARGADSPAAQGFLDFLKGDVAAGILATYGYGAP
jgi:molybdate transport system substrate-binding protein